MRAVIFDMDGVIVDSELYWDQLLPGFLQTRLPAFQAEDMRRVQGLSNQGLYDWLCENRDLQMEKEDFLEWLLDFADEIYETHVNLMPGFMNLLEMLHTSGIPKAIASSSPHRSIRIVVERFGLQHYFEALCSADDVNGVGKPNPAVFLHAAKSLNVRPENCLVLEDSSHGIRAGVNAGMRVIALSTEQNHEQNLELAHEIVDGFSGTLTSRVLEFTSMG